MRAKKIFMDYGELLFDFTFNKDTLNNAHLLALDELKKYNSQLTLEGIDTAHKQVIQSYLQNRKETKEEWTMPKLMKGVLQNLGLNQDLVVILEKIYKYHDHTAKPREGIIELIHTLKGRWHSLNIISNMPHDSPIKELSNYGLLESFETITFSYEAGFRKPHPAIYNLALAKSRITADEGMFFSHDIAEVEGARVVGLESHLVYTADEIQRALL